ncbi:MAG TPA: enoyl-CoA hydratase [Phenylobacterium sp.]|nr:enoyl-CoA hydratase [Phenylobacterium sp.]
MLKGPLSVDELQQVRLERPAPGVARVVMARPKARNAQGLRMTYELDAALLAAVGDPQVKVIVLAGDDPHFSAGHDLGETGEGEWPRVGVWADFDAPGAEGRFGVETEIYLDMCERWRNLSKPMIAAVQGKCIGGGLMLAWICDLIIASDDAAFRDPTLAMGVMGTEYFVHAWELGIRKAKEFIMLSSWLSAEDARQAGMVNRVVPRADLQATALEMAVALATQPQFAVRAAKLALNHAQDQAGRALAMRQSFALHQLTHAHNELTGGLSIATAGTTENIAAKVRR